MSSSYSSDRYLGFNSYTSLVSNPPNFQWNLISFVGAAQLLAVDFLPITWHSALTEAGRGGTATLRERLINSTLSLLFKRVHPQHFQQYGTDATSKVYETLAAEISTARHADVVKSAHLAHLEGISWDVESDGTVWPVLVYEKAEYGSVRTTMEKRQNEAPLDIHAKLRICEHVANGLATLHNAAIIHGDVKPDNVILFEHDSKQLLAKITDFGVATYCLSHTEEDGPHFRDGYYICNHITLTGPSFWTHPDRHEHGYSFEEAVLEEVYSFGMTCFWTLFHHLTAFPTREDIQAAKTAGQMPALCVRLAEDPEMMLAREQSGLLVRLFTITLNQSAKDRATLPAIVDFLRRGIMAQNQSTLQTFKIAPLPVESELSMPSFSVMGSLAQLLGVDFRVRSHIRQCMVQIIQTESRSEVLQRTHFELACCYHLGFGGPYDTEKRDHHLRDAGAGLEVIEAQVNKFRKTTGVTYFQGQFRTAFESGLLPPFDVVQAMRDVPASSDLITLMRREIESVERSLGPTSTHVVHMKASLAYLLWEHGQVEFARQMLLDSLKSLEDEPKKVEGWDLLFCKSQVAEAESRVGHWQEAERLCRNALSDALQLGKAHDAETVVIKNQLALALSDQGRWTEAAQLQKELVIHQHNSLGAQHPITLQFMLPLVQSLIELEQLSDAKYYMHYISESRDHVWGPDSQDTLLSFMEEARLLEMSGLNEEAEVIERKALFRCQNSLERNHPYYLDCMMNLALTLMHRAKIQEAIQLAEQSVAMYVDVRGKDHPDTLRSKVSLALVYKESSRWKDAEEMDLHAYERLKTLLGPAHPFTLESMHGLGQDYWKLTKLEEAEEILINTVQGRSIALGQEHQETLASRTMLSNVFADQGKLAEAIEMMEAVLAASKVKHGESHRETLIAATNLATMYDDVDDTPRAIAMEEATLETAKASLEPHDAVILTLTFNLATSYLHSSVGRYDEGLALAEEAVKMASATEDDPEGLANAQNILAQAYDKLGRHGEAREMHNSVLSYRQEMLGVDHPDTLDTLEMLQKLE